MLFKMQGIFIVVFCCVCYEITAQPENKISTTPILTMKSNWEGVTTSHQAFKELTKGKTDTFSCVLNLLKDALAEELQKSYYITEENAQENVSSINRTTEENPYFENTENQLEKPIMRHENEADSQNAYEKVVIKSTSEFSNLTNEQNSIEMPNMIPIFKPRPQPKSELNQYVADFSSKATRQAPTSKAIAFVPEKIIQKVMCPISSRTESNRNVADFNSITTNSRQISKSRAVSFVPEKIVQTNMSPIPNQALFNIPCQRAADVLDMSVVPKEVACRHTNVNPNADTTKPIFPSQTPAPVQCADEDDTVAMLFKPKNISLKQVYGNLLKKITITVLVPYHMSKLGGKQNSKEGLSVLKDCFTRDNRYLHN